MNFTLLIAFLLCAQTISVKITHGSHYDKDHCGIVDVFIIERTRTIRDCKNALTKALAKMEGVTEAINFVYIYVPNQHPYDKITCSADIVSCKKSCNKSFLDPISFTFHDLLSFI